MASRTDHGKLIVGEDGTVEIAHATAEGAEAAELYVDRCARK